MERYEIKWKLVAAEKTSKKLDMMVLRAQMKMRSADRRLLKIPKRFERLLKMSANTSLVRSLIHAKQLSVYGTCYSGLDIHVISAYKVEVW